MGLRFRKSFSAGPFRATLSKSGLGLSVGTKGARVARKAGGGYRASVGTGGLSYTKDFGKRKKRKKSKSSFWSLVLTLALLIAMLAACGGEHEPEPIPEVEEAPIAEESPLAEDVSELDTEEVPEEVIELQPVFVDPFGGDKDETQEEPLVEDPTPETPAADPKPPVVEDPVAPEGPAEQPAPNPPVSDPLTEPQPEPTPEPQPEPTPEPQPTPDPQLVTPPAETGGGIVYITETGNRYHRGTCRHLAESKIETTLDAAVSMGLTPCGTCH